MVAFIDELKDKITESSRFAQALQLASSNTWERKRRQMNPDQCLPRVKRDIMLREEIKRVWEEFLSLRKLGKYGGPLNREDIKVAQVHCGAPDERHGPKRGRSWQEDKDYDP